MSIMVEIENGRVKGYLMSGEFAKMWGVREVTVRQWIRRGKLESLKIGDTHWIKEDAVVLNGRLKSQ